MANTNINYIKLMAYTTLISITAELYSPQIRKYDMFVVVIVSHLVS